MKLRENKLIDQLISQLLSDQKDLQDVLSNHQAQQQIQKISHSILISANKNLDLVTNQYHAGNLQYLDLIQALESVSSAKTSNLTARYQLAKDYYQYQFYRGRLYHAIFN